MLWFNELQIPIWGKGKILGVVQSSLSPINTRRGLEVRHVYVWGEGFV